ncbi:MAG: FAD binding domain-containing protein [Desulfopila sp.]
MLQIERYHYASSLADAYQTLPATAGRVGLGGCGYIRLGDRKIATAIDLCRLDLDFVRETDTTVEIGAMTSLRTIETAPLCRRFCSGILARSVENIVGVQLRRGVTIGGTVAGRYPFSDPLTALVAVDAQLHFHQHGIMSLATFLHGQGIRDILEKVTIPKVANRRGAFTSIRRTRTDYPVLNAAISAGNDYRIVVGARPGRATLAVAAADYLLEHGLNATTAGEAGRLAALSLQFGDNPRGSAEYRRAVCPVLVTRALTEVLDAA